MEITSKTYLSLYLNKNMKWTFKSHKGFFIPVIYNNEIKGLRIHLDKEYKLDTTDIWFSSSKEYQGTNARNWSMIFTPENENNLKIIDSKNEEKDIIISSEILLAYKLFKTYNKFTIAVPNAISAKQGNEIIQNINIKNAIIYFDKHTIFRNPFLIYKNLINKIEDEKKEIRFVLTEDDIRNIEKGLNENVA